MTQFYFLFFNFISQLPVSTETCRKSFRSTFVCSLWHVGIYCSISIHLVQFISVKQTFFAHSTQWCASHSHVKKTNMLFTKHNSSFQLDFIQLTKLHFEMKAHTLFQQDRMAQHEAQLLDVSDMYLYITKCQDRTFFLQHSNPWRNMHSLKATKLSNWISNVCFRSRCVLRGSVIS